MRGISEERLRELFTGDCGFNLEAMLKHECQELNRWQPIDEFIKSNKHGWCWIALGKEINMAYYHDDGEFYTEDTDDALMYSEEHITHVIPLELPEPPK